MLTSLSWRWERRSSFDRDRAGAFGLGFRTMQFEPGGSREPTVAGKIRKWRQVTALRTRSFVHPCTAGIGAAVRLQTSGKRAFRYRFAMMISLPPPRRYLLLIIVPTAEEGASIVSAEVTGSLTASGGPHIR